MSDQNTIVYVVSFAPANSSQGIGGYDYFPANKKDEALVHYGKIIGIESENTIVRFIELDLFKENIMKDNLDDFLDSPDGLDMLEIEHPALYNHVPDTVDSINRIPFECRTREKVEKLIARDFNAENLVNSKKDINPDDAKMLIQMINTSLDLCDGYFSLDEYDTLEYVRGQAELIANVPFIDVDQETVFDIIRKLMHARSNIPYEILDKEI